MIAVLVLAGMVWLACWVAGKLVKGTVREVKSTARTVAYFQCAAARKPVFTAEEIAYFKAHVPGGK